MTEKLTDESLQAGVAAINLLMSFYTETDSIHDVDTPDEFADLVMKKGLNPLQLLFGFSAIAAGFVEALADHEGTPIIQFLEAMKKNLEDDD